MDQNILVWIEYKLVDNVDWKKIELTPDEYFDPLDEEDDVNSNGSIEEYDFDSVPKYFHAIDYIGCNIWDVEHTKVTILDISKQIKHIQSETFWNGGQNRIILTQTSVPGVSHCEIMVETLIQETPKTIQQVTLKIEDNIPKYQTQIVIKRNEDGSEAIIFENNL